MLTKNDLQQIRKVVKEEITGEVKPLRERIDTLELSAERRFHVLGKKIDEVQKTTTDILVAVTEDLDDHERRIQRVEKHLNLP